MKKNVSITLIALAALLTVNVAFAVSANSNRTVQALTETATEARQNGVIAKCTGISNSLNKKITNFDHQKEQHITSYSKTKEKIQTLITKLEGNGYDVEKLKTDLVSFDEKVAKFGTDYDSYKALLTTTKSDSCQKGEGDFRAKLAEARNQLKVVHQDAVEIRTFYAKTIRPDVLAIKAQKEKQKTTENTTNETSSEEGGE